MTSDRRSGEREGTIRTGRVRLLVVIAVAGLASAGCQVDGGTLSFDGDPDGWADDGDDDTTDPGAGDDDAGTPADPLEVAGVGVGDVEFDPGDDDDDVGDGDDDVGDGDDDVGDDDDDVGDDDDDDVEVETCADHGAHDDCATDEFCHDGQCTPVLGNSFRVTMLGAAVGDLDPQGNVWDEFSIAPDLFVLFGALGQQQLSTYTIWDDYEPIWNQYIDVVFEEYGGFDFTLMENDHPDYEPVFGAQFAGTAELVGLARLDGEPLEVAWNGDPEIYVELAVDPNF